MASSKADRQLLEAKSAIKHGELDRAKVLLANLVKSDRDNPEVWLWLSSVVDSKKERKACLERVLKYDPHHETAQRALASLGEEEFRDKVRIPFSEQVRDWEKELVIPKFSRFQQIMMSGIARPILITLGVVLALAILGFGGWGVRRLFIKETVDLGDLFTSTPSITVTIPGQEFIFTDLDLINKETPLADIIEQTATPVPTGIPYVELQFTQYEYNRSAMYAYRNQDWAGMVENLTALTDEEPGAFDAYYYLAIAYRNLEQYDEASAALQQAITINEEFGPAYVELAKLSMVDPGEETYTIAQDYLDTAYLYDPDMLEIQLTAAELNNMYGEHQKALTYLRKADRLQPNSFEVALSFADTYRLLDDPVNEAKYLLQAKLFDGTRLDIYRRLGEFYYEAGEYELAVEPLRIYLVYAEDTAPQYWAWVASCYIELGFDEEAEEAVAKAEAAAEDNVEIEYLIGKFYMDNGKYDKAEGYLESAARKRTRSPLYNFMLAKLYVEMGKCLSSIYYFDLAEFYAETNDLLPEIYYLRGQCHYELGNSASAPDDMEALLALQEEGVEINEDWIYYALDQLGLLPTQTPTLTPTETATPTLTATTTSTPTVTITEVPTVTPSRTNTSTKTPTRTRTPSD